MALFKTRAVVVQSTPFKEHDKRVVLITEDFGKIVGIAPGAKKSQKRFGAALESLTLVSAIFFEKEHQSLVRLQETHILKGYGVLKKDIRKIAYGSYFLELISEVTKEREAWGNPCASLFAYLLSFLNALEISTQEELLSRLFEARLLPKIGWQPMLTHCLDCKTSIVNLSGGVVFSYLAGGIMCQRCQSRNQEPLGETRQISREAIAYMCRMMSGEKSLDVNLKLGGELKHFLPLFIFHQLGKELRSYRFIQTLIAE